MEKQTYPTSKRIQITQGEHYKSGNTGVLDLGHSLLDITQETSVGSE